MGIVALIFAAFACSKPESEPSYLFVIHAQGSQMNPDSTTKGTLTLNNASKNVFFFSERPNRQAGKMTVQSFLSNWSKGPNSFKEDHPNAALVGNMSSQDHPFTEIPVLVYAPEYNAESDQLILKIKTFDTSHKLEQQNLDEVILFMDADEGVLPTQFHFKKR